MAAGLVFFKGTDVGGFAAEWQPHVHSLVDRWIAGFQVEKTDFWEFAVRLAGCQKLRHVQAFEVAVVEFELECERVGYEFRERGINVRDFGVGLVAEVVFQAMAEAGHLHRVFKIASQQVVIGAVAEGGIIE